MGVYAGGNSYGIPEDLIYSFPIQLKVSHQTLLCCCQLYVEIVVQDWQLANYVVESASIQKTQERNRIDSSAGFLFISH